MASSQAGTGSRNWPRWILIFRGFLYWPMMSSGACNRGGCLNICWWFELSSLHVWYMLPQQLWVGYHDWMSIRVHGTYSRRILLRIMRIVWRDLSIGLRMSILGLHIGLRIMNRVRMDGHM
jgi:hypothetical protein